MKALFIIISAVVIAIITGFIFQFLERRNLIEKNDNIVEIEEDFFILRGSYLSADFRLIRGG